MAALPYMPRVGVVHIHAKAGIVETWGLTTRQVGKEWLAYLSGEPSVFERFCRFKERRPSRRPSTAEWRETRKRVFERDGYRCTYCGSVERLACDHIVPVALGGDHLDDNLTTACQSCNSSKGALPPEEFERRRNG